MKYLNITYWRNILLCGGLVGTTFLSCTDDEMTTKAWTLEDSIKNSVHFQGVITPMRQPGQTRSLIMRGNGDKATSTNLFSDLTLTPAWNTRCTVDSLSNWYGMVNRRMSIKINGELFGNFFVSETGVIAAPLGPFVFGPTIGGGATSLAEAWYPSTGMVELDTFIVKKDQSAFDRLEASDLLYGRYNVGTNKIEFSHKMAQVEVHLRVNRVVPGTVVIGGIPTSVRDTIIRKVRSVRLANCFRAGKVDKTAATVSFAAGTLIPDMNSMDTVTLCHYPDSDKFGVDAYGNGDTTFCYKGLIFPQDTTMKLIVDIGGTEYEGELSRYTYNDGILYNINVDLMDELKFFIDDTCHVGDFLCVTEDGMTARAFDTAHIDSAYIRGYHPIGIIFSDSTSDFDRAMGWTHGYAIALDFAPEGSSSGTYWWANNTSTKYMATQYPGNWSAALTQMNGYEETHYITDDPNYNSGTHPAFFAAINYNSATPIAAEMLRSGTTSGWFLPSLGQEMLLLRNIGKPTSEAVTYGSNYYYWYDMTGTVRNNTNKVLNYAVPHLPYYNSFYSDGSSSWVTTEANEGYAYHMYFPWYMEWGWNWHKQNSCYVRPVIAF